MKKIIQTSQAPKPVGPYSQAVQQGPFLFCSGQIAIDPSSDEVQRGTVESQTQRVMKNIEAVLKEAGYDFSHVVKTTIYLTDMNDFAQVNSIYAQYFTSSPQARSTVAVSGLPKGVQVEIEVTAYRG
jgi:2-iminobutanoate/2-iminopropanoate deaminase